MEWVEIERDKLLEAAEIMEMVPQQSSVPSSDYVRLQIVKNAMIMAIASTVLGQAMVPGKFVDLAKSIGEAFLDRRLWLPFILLGRKWKGNFKMAFATDRIFLMQGSRKGEFLIRASAVAGYGVWKDRSSMKEVKLSEATKEMLVASAGCATADPSMPHLNCIYLGMAGKDGVVLASNTSTIFLGKKAAQSAIQYPFPVGIIAMLSKGPVKAIGVEGDLVVLDCGCGYVEGIVSAKAKGFPHRSILLTMEKGKALPVLARIPIPQLANMVARLTEYVSGVRREDWILKLTMTPGKVVGSVHLSQGKFSERFDCDEIKKEGSVEWPLELLKPVLDFLAIQENDWLTVRVDEAKKSAYMLVADDVELMIARRK